MTKKILNNHQILYAKNFYRHSGDIIADMRKVCKLDYPLTDFYSPKYILNFMRKQFNAWLDANPSINKERGSKVRWEDDPVKAEIWSILIAYNVFVPMSCIGGYIKELPNYEVMKPQYNTQINSIMSRVFTRDMTPLQLTEKAKQVLNMPMLEIMDKLASDLVDKFDFKKASDILKAYGIERTPEELDDELWGCYSDLIDDHIKDVDGVEVLDEGSFTRITDHFVLNIDSRNIPNNTVEIHVDLCPLKWEVIGDKVLTEANYRQELTELAEKVTNMARVDSQRIVDSTENIDVIWEDVPDHLKEVDEVESMMECSPKIYLDYWKSDAEEFKLFAEHAGDYSLMTGSGCFDTHIFNVDGKIKMILAHTTMFDCSCFEHELWSNGSSFINDKKE